MCGRSSAVASPLLRTQLKVLIVCNYGKGSPLRVLSQDDAESSRALSAAIREPNNTNMLGLLGQ
jgi:hypothetical protein